MTDAGITIIATHNIGLVILSVVIAIIASYTALDLSGRVTVALGRTRTAWLAGGAIAMGVGIWSMHFIAMLAYNLPISIAYNLPIVLVSMAVAVVASGVALFVVSRQKMGGLQLLAGGIFMGLGIVAMHYTGMAAMRLEATPLYDPNLVALSIAIAIGASLIALRLAFHLRTETTVTGSVWKIGSAIVMGSAIAGMHYTAMAAVSFNPTNQLVLQPSHAMDNSLLGVGIGITTLVILTLALITSLFDQRISTETARAEVLRQSEERFRSLLQNASDIIAVFAADGTVSYASSSVKRILGYEPENWNSAFELVHPDDLTKAESLLTAAQSCPDVKILAEFRLQRADGQARDFEVIVINLLTDPWVAGIITTYCDITERKRAESALQKAYDELEIRVEQRTNELSNALEQLRSEIIERQRAESALKTQQEFLRNVIDTAPNWIFVKDWDGKYILANKATADFFGTKIADLVGKTNADINANQEEVKQFLCNDREVMEMLSEQLISEEIVTDDTGKLRWFQTIKKPIISSDGTRQVLGVSTDITERKRAEEELYKSEARNRALVNAIPDLILRISKNGTYLDFKQAKNFDMLVPDSELIGKSEYEVLPPALAEQRMHYVERALSTGDIQIFEYQLLLNGSIQYEEARIVVSGDDEVLAIIRDISDRKQAEEALRESQQMLQSVMNNIPQFIFWKDRKSVFLGCNCNFAQLAGFGNPENIVGKTDYDLPWKKEEANFFRECDRRVMETDTPEYHIIEPLLQANGEQVWLDTNKVPLHDSRGNVVGILGTFEDITARKQAEEALRDAHQRLTFHVENSPLAVVEWDKEMRVLRWSPQAEKVFGWAAKEVLGLRLCDWQFVFAEDEEAFRNDVFAPLLSGREQRNVTSNRNYTKDGSVVHCQWYNSVLLDESGEMVSVQSLTLDITARLRAKEALKKAHDELEIRVQQRTTELRTANEQLLVEITERKRVEEEIKKLNEDLKRRTVELEAANKELEAFSYSVSHDLRAPLRAINGFSRILLNEYAPQLTPEARRYLQMVQNNGQQMGCLVDDLLTFSRLGRSPLKKHRVHPNDLVCQALTDLRDEQQGRQVEISSSDLPVCQADSALLKQVWVNLLANALKFTRQREVACIEVGYHQIDGKQVYFVKDNGVGFEMQYAHKLFGVFQRLHRAEEYEGTGVGLAIVQRVIHRHGGLVWAEAEVNKGATFYFTLGGDIPHDRDRSRNPVSGRQP